MPDWKVDLGIGIRSALARNKPCTIVVHNKNQAESGKIAAEGIANQLDENPKKLTFKIIPKENQNDYPIGMIVE